jgi:hypothetical protein
LRFPDHQALEKNCQGGDGQCRDKTGKHSILGIDRTCVVVDHVMTPKGCVQEFNRHIFLMNFTAYARELDDHPVTEIKSNL